MIRTLKIFISLVLIFLLHRYYAWHFLAQQYGPRSVILWREILVGLMSDVWIAGVLSLPLWGFEYFRSPKATRWQRRLGFSLIVLVGALTAGHQSYVEFFKFQIIPFHLSYLFDSSFLKSNSSSVLDPAPTIIIIVTAALAYWSKKATQIVTRRPLHIILGGLLCVVCVSHALNIRWRINWFVIEPLQTNYLESLYANFTKKPRIKGLSEDEKVSFTKLTGHRSWLWLDHTKKNFQRPQPLATLRSAIQSMASVKKPVILGIILSESLRSSDVGPRPQDSRSLTPYLDRLQSTGVKFANVYSSGPVTRGGQEAAWCGTPSATDTSLMRSYPDLDVECVPKQFRDRSDMISLWSHGGDERFDSQLMFWSHQGVTRFLTKSDFPENAPATGWGISDLALFEKTAQTLQDIQTSGKARVILPLILTVTNHIPWAIPDDASIETKNFLPKHPSHRTVRYFDESLGLFVASLKEKNLWDNSVFIVAGDHGNLEQPWRDDYPNDPMKWERLLSHISVTLTGGIVERLSQTEKLPSVFEDFSSQTQIASFIHDLASSVDATKKRGDIMWDAPLFSPSPWVVSSDLNQYLFLPGDGIRLDKEDVLAGGISESQTRQWLAAFRYRGWLEFLYSAKNSH